MKNSVNTARFAKSWRWEFQASLLMIALIFLAGLASGQEKAQIAPIRIVTPVLEGYANKDGTGLWFEIVRAVYEPIGIKLTYEIMPWKRALNKLELQEADAILGEYENEKLLMPRYPLDVERTGVVFAKKNIPAWEGLKSLAGKTIVWFRGYDYQTTSELKGIQYKWYEVDMREQAWKMIENQRVDFYLDDLKEVNLYLKSHNVDLTRYQVETVWTNNTYLAFAKAQRSEQLIKMYDERIPQLLASGELQKIFEKWAVPFPEFKPEDE